jgi:hypothetical protein
MTVASCLFPLAGSARAQAPPLLPSASNEPSGMHVLAAYGLSTIPPDPSAELGIGKWGSYPYPSSSIRVVSDSDRGSVAEIQFKAGLSGGSTRIKIWAAIGTTEFRRIYARYWLKLDGTSYENQAVETKLSFVGSGRSPAPPQNDNYLSLKGAGTTATRSCWAIGFQQQNGVHARRWSSQQICAGRWYKIELLLVVNTMGRANGIATLWVDGVRVLDATDVVFRKDGYPAALSGFSIAPVWGGKGGTKTKNDAIRFADVYVSGSP